MDKPPLVIVKDMDKPPSEVSSRRLLGSCIHVCDEF